MTISRIARLRMAARQVEPSLQCDRATPSSQTAPAGPQLTGDGKILADLQPSPVSFTLPTPPSTNALFRNVRGKGRVRTSAYDHWLAMAVTAIRQQKVPAISSRVVMVMGVERMSLSADIDNRMKASWDAIVKSGALADDSLVTAFAAAWQPAANGLTRIALHPADQSLTITYHPSQNGACGGWFCNAPQQDHEDENL